MASEKFLKEFMKIRFPRERKGNPYWEEWEQRLMKGDPRIYMDDKTLKVFKKLKKKYGVA